MFRIYLPFCLWYTASKNGGISILYWKYHVDQFFFIQGNEFFPHVLVQTVTVWAVQDNIEMLYMFVSSFRDWQKLRTDQSWQVWGRICILYFHFLLLHNILQITIRGNVIQNSCRNFPQTFQSFKWNSWIILKLKHQPKTWTWEVVMVNSLKLTNGIKLKPTKS